MSRLLLLIGMAVLLAGSVQAFTVNETIFLNGSSDNVVKAKLNITLAPNASILVWPTNYTTSDLEYEYPMMLFYDDVSERELIFNVTRNKTFVQDVNISSVFRLTNTLNNNSYFYNLTTNVFAKPDPEDFFIELINGGYFINISTELIPKSGSLNYEVRGLSGEKIYIDCSSSSWFTCPNNRTFDSNNKTTFSINYLIPSSAPLGKVIYPIELTTGNLTTISNVTFNIFDPGLIISTFVFTEDCFVVADDGTLTVTLECIEAKEEHDIARLRNIINSLRAQINTTCEPEIVEEPVYFAKIEDFITEELNTCRTTRNDLTSDVKDFEEQINSKQSQLNQCQQDLRLANQRILNNETTCLESVFDTSVRLKNEADALKTQALLEAKEHRWTTAWIIILFVVMCCCAVGLFLWYRAAKKSTWTG